MQFKINYKGWNPFTVLAVLLPRFGQRLGGKFWADRVRIQKDTSKCGYPGACVEVICRDIKVSNTSLSQLLAVSRLFSRWVFVPQIPKWWSWQTSPRIVNYQPANHQLRPTYWMCITSTETPGWLDHQTRMEVWWLGVMLNVEVTVAKLKINSMTFSNLLVQASSRTLMWWGFFVDWPCLKMLEDVGARAVFAYTTSWLMHSFVWAAASFDILCAKGQISYILLLLFIPLWTQLLWNLSHHIEWIGGLPVLGFHNSTSHKHVLLDSKPNQLILMVQHWTTRAQGKLLQLFDKMELWSHGGTNELVVTALEFKNKSGPSYDIYDIEILWTQILTKHGVMIRDDFLDDLLSVILWFAKSIPFKHERRLWSTTKTCSKDSLEMFSQGNPMVSLCESIWNPCLKSWPQRAEMYTIKCWGKTYRILWRCFWLCESVSPKFAQILLPVQCLDTNMSK